MKLSIHSKLYLLLFLFPFLSCESEEEPEEPQLPEIVTVTSESEAVTTYTSVEITGAVSDTEDAISSYGVVWGTNPNPTLEDNVVIPSDASTFAAKKSALKQTQNSFTIKIDDLTPGQSYHFRTFATNEAGTAYGEEISVETVSFAESKWEITFHHAEDNSWLAHVTFYEDGTAFYTEPDYPGQFDHWGDWSMDGNTLTYDLMAEEDNTSYILTGEVEENELSGTYSFGEEDKPFTGVLLSSE